MFKHYLTTALRHFKQHKFTTSINVVSLAMGLACFLVAHGLSNYFRQSDVYHEKADRTYILTTKIRIGGSDVSPTVPRSSFATAKFLKADEPALELVARASTFGDDVSLVTGDNKAYVKVSYADGDFLKIFDLPFAHGNNRTALAEPHSAVISQALATQLFGNDNPIGRPILLNNRETIYVRGVITEPRQPSHMSTVNSNASLYFQALVSMDVHEALIRALEPPELAEHQLNLPYGFMWYQTYVVLRDNGSLTKDSLNRSLKSFSTRHIAKAASNIETFLALRPVSEITISMLDLVTGTEKTGVSSTSLLLTLGVLVLAIAALNYANLASAQAVSRSKEIALRRVVGAGRRQIMTQYLFETTLLVSIALFIAIGAVLAIAALQSGPMQSALSRVFFGVNSLRFGGFIAALIVGVSLLASAYPAFVLSGVKPVQALRGGRVTMGKRAIFSLFVGAQFFAASFLLIAVIVMGKQNQQLRAIGLSTGDNPVIAIGNSVRTLGVDMTVLRTELLRYPQIKSVTATMFPLGISANDGARITQSSDPAARKMTVALQLVDYDFFATTTIALRTGRLFDREHGNDISGGDSKHPAGNIVIDESLARSLGWSNSQEALGQSVFVPGLANGPDPQQPSTIIGVVADKPLYAINSAGTGTIYQLVPSLVANPLIQISKSDIPGALAAIDAVWSKLAPNTSLQRRFLDEQFAQALFVFELVTGVFNRVAIFALLIASVGLVGMATHIVSRRTHEIGVRKTLGASILQVLALLLKDFSKPVLIANLVAWPLAFAAMSVYLSIFVSRTSLSIVPFIGSLLLTLGIAWLAVGLQAVRAARLHPASVLRHE